MTKRFVIGTAQMTKEQEERLLEFIEQKKLGWWHWLPNFWLIKDPSDQVSASDLRDAVPAVNCIVMEIYEDITWATRGGKNSKGKDFSDWLKKTWPEKK